MAGIGPPPKSPRTRQRRNAVAGMATLAADDRAEEVPPLPVMGRAVWHVMTVQWWEDVWTDPVSSRYARSDKHGLYRLAVVVDRFWKLTAANPQRVKLSAEIRQLESKFGLSPLDRRRLQVEIEKGEDAEERTNQREARRRQVRRKPGDDPREMLKAVK